MKSIVTTFLFALGLGLLAMVNLTAEDATGSAAGTDLQEGKTVPVTFKYEPSRRERRTLEEVTLAGDFNNWDPYATPLTKNEDDEWTVTLNLEPGKEYLWKFLLNGSWTQNMETLEDKISPKPDEYVADPYGGKNAKLIVKKE